MATIPSKILVREGSGNYVVWMLNSTDAVKPGHIVTTTGEGDRAVAWADADGDISYGVVGCAPGHDPDTAYGTGVMMPVYTREGGAQVWVRAKTSLGANTAGQILMNDGATTANGLAIVGADSATLPMTKIGEASQTSADVAQEKWLKMTLGS